MYNEIVESINRIDSTIMEAEMNVIDTMMDVYSKAAMIMEYCDDNTMESYGIIQECFIVEGAKYDAFKDKWSEKKGILAKMINVMLSLIDRFTKWLNSKKKSKDLPTDEDVSDDISDDSNLYSNHIDFNQLEKVLNTILETKDFNDISNSYKKYNSIIYNENISVITREDADHFIEINKMLKSKIIDIKNTLDGMVNVENEEFSLVSSKLEALEGISGDTFRYVMGVYNKNTNNIKPNPNDINKEYGFRYSAVRKGSSSKYTLFRYSTGRTEPAMFPEKEKEFYKKCADLRTTKDYSTYKKLYDEIFNICKLPKDHVIKSGSIDLQGVKYNEGVSITVYNTSEKIAKLKPGTKLYHTSTVKGLTELKPFFKASPNVPFTTDSMYPTERIYFFIDNPGIRTDTNNDKRYKKSGYMDVEVYEYIVTGSEIIKFDVEAGYKSFHKAVFIETDKPIKVKCVTDEF